MNGARQKRNSTFCCRQLLLSLLLLLHRGETQGAQGCDSWKRDNERCTKKLNSFETNSKIKNMFVFFVCFVDEAQMTGSTLLSAEIMEHW